MIPSLNDNAALARVLADNPQHDSYPDHTVDYFDRFTRIDDHLNKHIHPNVNVGPTAREPIWLTDHGPEHIATVIRRAGNLAIRPPSVLSPYECYVLLLACQFHDVGNIFGRKDHEKKVREVMFALDPTLVGDDTLEKRLICDIAMSHGGYVDDATEDKDTIGRLPYDRSTKTNGLDVKKLAAILRFADELADDRTRTNRFVQNAVHAVLPASEIYHAYAAHLRPSVVHHDSRSVDIHFEVNVDDLQRTYLKHAAPTYLYDEILLRTLKMHREHIYCSRFMLPDIVIERITVQIDVCSGDYSQVLGRIFYTMAPLGYPPQPGQLSDICPELAGISGASLSAEMPALVAHHGGAQYTPPVDLLSAKEAEAPHAGPGEPNHE